MPVGELGPRHDERLEPIRPRLDIVAEVVFQIPCDLSGARSPGDFRLDVFHPDAFGIIDGDGALFFFF